MIISLIVVADEMNGIGKDNALLCHLPADLRYFKQITTGHHIVMGRKTFESVGKPLPNRINVVISGNKDLKCEGCVVVESLQEAIQLAQNSGEVELFITGGGSIYRQAIPLANSIYLTRMHTKFDADTFFPQLDNAEWQLSKSEFHEKDEKNPVDYSFEVYQRL